VPEDLDKGKVFPRKLIYFRLALEKQVLLIKRMSFR
jgi:hypothetical protein